VEGEHTIIGKIPRERLNQIASRKLSALGIPVRLGQDRETLEGELSFAGRVLHPGTGQSLPRARFVVVGHDQLRFSDPPLAALGPIGFYEHERPVQLEIAVANALAQRVALLQDVAARMRALRLEAAIDAERLAVRAVVKAPTHAFELIGAPDGVRVSRVAPVGGRPFEVSPDFQPLDLQGFGSATDVELFLSSSLSRMQPAQRSTPVPTAAHGGTVRATPPPRNALTLAVLSKVFGEDAMLAPNAMVELVQEFEHGGTRYRFVATREMGTQFKGRLIGPNGDVWSDRFDLANFPGTGQVVALALGATEAAPEPGGSAGLMGLPGAAAFTDGGEFPGHLQPHPGEIWVMNVVVEAGDGDEIRYTGTDIDGKPYGAARVLKRSDFEAVFVEYRGGWRLLIQIDQLQEGHVIYRQLDRQRQPMGAPRKMASAILVANFVPETAAY
jgi:hypothetical protein